MLDPADDDLIALVDVTPSPSLGYQVDGLGCTADKDDFFGRRSIEEVRYLGARILIGIGGARRQIVGGTMNVGVLVLVEIRDPVDHALRLLRGCRIVQPDQGAAMDAFL